MTNVIHNFRKNSFTESALLSAFNKIPFDNSKTNSSPIPSEKELRISSNKGENNKYNNNNNSNNNIKSSIFKIRPNSIINVNTNGNSKNTDNSNNNNNSINTNNINNTVQSKTNIETSGNGVTNNNNNNNRWLIEKEKKNKMVRNLKTAIVIVIIAIAFIISIAGLIVSIYFYASDTTTDKHWKLYGLLCSLYFLVLSIITVIIIILMKHFSTNEKDLYTVVVNVRKIDLGITEKQIEKTTTPRVPPQMSHPQNETPNAPTPETRIQSPETGEAVFVLDSQKPTNELIQYAYEKGEIERNKQKVIYIQENRKKPKELVYDIQSPKQPESIIHVIENGPDSHYNNEVSMVQLPKNTRNKKRRLVLSYIPNKANRFFDYHEPKPKTNVKYMEYPKSEANYIYTVDTDSEQEYVYKVVEK